MADAIYCADVLYPEYNDGDEIKEYVQRVSDYLFLLREGLGYTLDNLGINNFSPTSIQAIGDVIREPVMVQLTDQEGKLAEFSATLEGISSTVSEIDGNYVSSTSFTQTSGNFQFRIDDGDKNAAVIMDAAGLTVYKGKIAIKNNNNDNVMYADETGNLVLTGTVTGSTIQGSTISGSTIYSGQLYTCASDDIQYEPHIYIGTQNSIPYIMSYRGAVANGFQAVGDLNNPYYGLFIAGIGSSAIDIDYRTYYDSGQNMVYTMHNGGGAYIAHSVNEVAVAYAQGGVSNYMQCNITGLHLVGNVTINGRTPLTQ